MFDNFPYTDMHQLNLDWIIKIAKDFLDQYTQIQDTIQTGLDDLDAKAEQLEGLLQAWYDTHSEDIANQLAAALRDLNAWYTEHQGYLDAELARNITAFNTAAELKATETIATIPDDYTALSDNVLDNSTELNRILNRHELNTYTSLTNTTSTQTLYILNNPIKKGQFFYGFDWYTPRAGDLKYYFCKIVNNTAIAIKAGVATAIDAGNQRVRFTPIIADDDLYLAVGNDTSTRVLLFATGNGSGTYGTVNTPIMEVANETNIQTTGAAISYNSNYAFAYGITLYSYDYANLAEIETLKDDMIWLNGSSSIDYRIPAAAFTNSGCLNPLNGELKTASGYYTTDYMDFDAYEQYTGIGFPIENITQFTTFCIYDDSQEFIAPFNGPLNILRKDYPTAKYFRVSANMNNFDQYYVVCHPYGKIIGEIPAMQEIQKRIEKSWLPKGLQIIENNPLRYFDIDEKFGFVGRWYKQTVNDHDCYVTNNCGSEFYFSTEGCSIVFIEWVAMTNTNAYYTYIIDNQEPVRLMITNNQIDLPDTGKHYIRIITDGITEDIGKWNNGTGFAFYDITLNTGESHGAMPANPQVMFFGDSITEGIRALGIDDEDMGNTNSSTHAFPWYCAKKMNIIPFRIGYGASGIKQAGSFRTADNALKYLYHNIPVPVYYPDAIVINYGQNDTVNSAFTTAYTEYLNDIQLKYPGVKIFVMIPFSQHAAAAITSVVNNMPGITLIETSTWTGITTVDGTHPDAAGAEVAGNYLADALINLIY